MYRYKHLKESRILCEFETSYMTENKESQLQIMLKEKNSLEMLYLSHNKTLLVALFFQALFFTQSMSINCPLRGN